MAAIDDLVTATTDLLDAVNVAKGTLDEAVQDATDQANLATSNGEAQVTLATAQANAAASNANAAAASNTGAGTSAGAAASSAVVAATARDAAIAAWGAAMTPAETLPAISLTFHTGAIVKGVIYDTSKDSDGGAWRKRCADKSWYNEAINGKWLGERTNEAAARAVSGATTGDYYHNTTDGKFYALNVTSGQAEVFRGNVREFPELVDIVAEAQKVVIYDLTQPSVPMWMVFAGSNAFSLHTTTGSDSVAGMTAVNGEIYIAQNNTGRLILFSFVRDVSYARINDTTAYAFHNGLSSRNVAANVNFNLYFSAGLANRVCNDVAAIVLPDAPADLYTGLPIPTVAVATDGGVSVIHNTGAVVNSAGTSAVKRVSISRRNELIADLGPLSTSFSVNRDVASLAASFALTSTYSSASTPSAGGGTFSAHISSAVSSLVKGHTAGLAMFRENPANTAKSTVAYITNAYNSGWMVGDIRGAWLAESGAETLTASGELVTNGDFSSGNTTGWATLNSAAISVVSGSMRVTAGAPTPVAAFAVATVVGKAYSVGFQLVTPTSGKNVFLNVGNAAGSSTLMGGTPYSAAGTYSGSFIATSTTTYISAAGSNAFASGDVFDVNKISCKLAVADRSVKANGLIVNGSITKAAVASGADLMAFSGFSASNYLEQPYSANLDFGTGDFFIMGWSKGTAAGTLLQRQDATDAGAIIRLNMPGTGVTRLALGTAGSASSTLYELSAPDPLDGGWHFIIVMRRNGLIVLCLDGVVSIKAANSMNLTNTAATLRTGLRQDGTNPHVGSLALMRMGAGAPSDDQIRFIYETEKKLFEANAKCLIDGTSTAVAALAYDENSDQLHVGTSWGRSAFRDLVRVESSATSVGALTALAGNQGAHITAGATAARYTQPAMQVRDELRRRDDARKALGKIPVAVDFDTIGFTGNTTSGSKLVTSVSVTTGTPYVGMGVTGSGVQAGTVLEAISGTTYTLSLTATATASTVAMAQNTFTMPKGFTALEVRSAGSVKRPGATKDYTTSFDGFAETITFGTSPGNAAWVRVLATRSN